MRPLYLHAYCQPGWCYWTRRFQIKRKWQELCFSSLNKRVEPIYSIYWSISVDPGQILVTRNSVFLLEHLIHFLKRGKWIGIESTWAFGLSHCCRLAECERTRCTDLKTKVDAALLGRRMASGLSFRVTSTHFLSLFMKVHWKDAVDFFLWSSVKGRSDQLKLSATSLFTRLLSARLMLLDTEIPD